jgi:hypothetical protein
MQPSWAFRVVAFLRWEATGTTAGRERGHLPVHGGAHQEVLGVDPNAPARHRGRRRGLAGLPLQAPGTARYRQRTRACRHRRSRAPRPGCQGRESGPGSSAAHRASGCGRESSTRATAAASLPAACPAAVTLTQRASKARRGPRASPGVPDADRRPRASARTLRPAWRTLVGNSCLCSGLNSCRLVRRARYS